MFIGGLIWPSKVVIAQLDTNAIRAASGFDDDFREYTLVDSDSDGIGEAQRIEKAHITLSAQIATRHHEFADQAPHGQVPKTDNLELTFSFQELEALGLRAADGRALLVPGDRLVRIEDQNGNTVHTYPDPPGMYLIASRPSGFLGQQPNILVCTFADRRQDAILREQREKQV